MEIPGICQLNYKKIAIISLLGSPAGIAGMVGLVAFVASMDYLTTWEVPLGLFYILPIALVAMYHSIKKTAFVVLLSVAAWSWVDFFTNRPMGNAMVPIWNMLVRVIAFGFIGKFIHHARMQQLRQKDLTSYIVHDLRNPATSLGLTLEALAILIQNKQSESLVNNGLQSVQQLNRLLDSLLDLARIEAGAFQVKQEVVNVIDVIKTSVGNFDVIANHRGIRFSIDDKPIHLDVRGDASLVQRVFDNILSNAIKMSPQGGCITTSLEFSVTGEAIIRFRDEGPGIPPNLAERIFEPFVQLELHKKGGGRGTGLGLTFCRAAVHEMGGKIWVEGTGGSGTTIAISLPSETKSTQEAIDLQATAKARQPESPTETLLVRVPLRWSPIHLRPTNEFPA